MLEREREKGGGGDDWMNRVCLGVTNPLPPNRGRGGPLPRPYPWPFVRANWCATIGKE